MRAVVRDMAPACLNDFHVKSWNGWRASLLRYFNLLRVTQYLR